MRRTLRTRLFTALLGCVLLAVGVSLALGVVLTRGAVRDTIRADLERQAEGLAAQLSQTPTGADRLRKVPGLGEPTAGGTGAKAGGPPASPAAGPPVGGPLDAPGPTVEVLSLSAAAAILPDGATASLRSDGAADGTASIQGRDLTFAARRSGDSVVLVTRPDVLSGDDFSHYLTALLLAGAGAVLLAAIVAGLLAQRLVAPLRRLGLAARELADGRRPEPVVSEGTQELDDLAVAFNGMADQLGRARDAERSVLLSVSHDLRTPLTSIRGYAEGLEDGTVEPEVAAPVIGREAGRLERLVSDLMALARFRQGVLEIRSQDVDLVAIAEEAAERVAPRARAAGVAVEVEGGPADAVADHGRLLQVVSNLVENAVRVSPEGGEVTVTVAPGKVEVADRGPGIPDSELENAFERFHLRSRLGGVGEGAGLGLAIVHELSVAMGGTAEVANRADGGARFTIVLPKTS